MALKSYSAVSGSNTKIRAEQIRSEEEGLQTLAGELFAIKGQIADIIGEASFMEQAPSDVQMLDLHQHLNAQGGAELVVKLDLAASGSVHMLGTLDVDGEATLNSAIVEDLTASRLVASDANQGLVSADLSSWVAGTADQVIVTDDTDGSITLSLPQSIATGSSPTFAGVTVTGLAPGRVVFVGASDELVDDSDFTFASDVLTINGSTFGNNVTIAGNLTVQGTTTQIDTTNLLVADAKIVISSGSVVDGAGIYLGNDAAGENIRWDVAGDKWIASDKFAADTMQALDLSSAIVWADASGNLVEIGNQDLADAIEGRLTAGTGVSISEAGAAITIAIGQPVETSSVVTFAAVTGSNLTASRLMASDANKVMVSADLSAWVAGTADQVLVADDADGSITLSLPQSIATGSSPSFADLSLSGELAFGSAGSLSFSGDDLIISGTVGELYFADENAVPGGWSNALGIKLSDSAAEWTNFESAFGEVSLLAAIYQAGSATNAVNKYVKAILAPGVAADAATAIGGGLDFAVVGDMAKKVDVFLNGQMMVSGSSSDYTVGGTDNVTFKFALEAGDVVAVVVR
jgi:hypothetical protein